VPETSLAAVVLGAPVQIYLDAFPEQALGGRVQRIWPTANRQKATVEVRVAFDAPDPRLRPEMGVRAVFQADTAQAAPEAPAAQPGILIPRSCLVRVDGQRGAFVLERDQVAFRALDLGEESGERVLARAGLQDGERVVLDPPASLKSGDRVVVKE